MAANAPLLKAASPERLLSPSAHVEPLSSLSHVPPTDESTSSVPSRTILHSPQPSGPPGSISSLLDTAHPINAQASSSRPRTPKRLKVATPSPTTPERDPEFQPPLMDNNMPLLGSGPIPRSPDSTRPLNVTDALSYLDAVKMQFQDKPDVYNKFLDIMKDFKGQIIDTPGVIERVSYLFQSNLYLIQGFNTFLPPGYRIELSTRQADLIIVTTPMGVVTQSTNGSSIRLPREPVGSSPHFNGTNIFNMNVIPPPPLLPLGLGPGSRPVTPLPHHTMRHQSPFTETGAPFSPAATQGTQTTEAASFLGYLGGRAVEKSPSGEFNHAIQYLNKIKMRYSDHPETYKQFLEILQTYQKEQRQLQDSQVYVQVQMLFKDSPDLMDEFKDFLPEAIGPPSEQMGLVGILPNPGGGPSGSGSWAPFDPQPPTEKTKAPARRRKRPAPADKDTVPKAASNRNAKRTKPNPQKPESRSPKFSPYQHPPSPPPAHIHPPPPPVIQHPVISNHVMPLPSVVPHNNAPPPVSTNEELMFFDRVKRALESGGTYDEFLKLLSLYARDIVDTKGLIERAQIFLGDGELMNQFKELMHWDSKQGNIEYGPPGSIRTAAPDPILARLPNDDLGPSYRQLPVHERRLACSGRDELAKSVLNDEWQSHPTWASEDAGFVSHKKSSFEETLHKSEEERHEYQVHIEALSRLIAVLEPLDARIDKMTTDERAQFKLPADLGGTNRVIYQRIIKKIYGRESGAEVYKALQECPSVAVPVVLTRLKLKDYEWRKLQTEWRKTWREVDAKNFYKALDIQGISFKTNDKKNITAKHFVQEIENLRAQQIKDQKAKVHPPFIFGSVGYQLEYEFHDVAVLHDSLKMIYSFLDHSQTQYGPRERHSIEQFLRSFIPLLFMYPSHEFNAACGPLGVVHEDEPVEDMTLDDDSRSPRDRSGKHSAGGSGQISGVAAGDLRKRLLSTVQNKSPHNGRKRTHSRPQSVTLTRSSSPLMADSASALGHGAGLLGGDINQEDGRSIPGDVWIKEAADDGVIAGETPITKRPFFANTTFYTLLRLLQLLYSRLLMCKEIGALMAAEKHASLLANPVAVQLGLDEPNGPSVILSQAAEAIGAATPGETPNVLYMYLLDACEKVFENELDQATFEEHMRWFFGTQAYHVFTLDKVITAVIKQVQTVMVDHKCQDLLHLLQTMRSAEIVTAHDAIRYRREAEHHVGSDDNLYRIDWDKSTSKLIFQLVGVDDSSIEEDNSECGRWREYIATYVMCHPTERTPATREDKISRPFLRRSLVDAGNDTIVAQNEMQVRISLGSYKIFYEGGKEDVLWCRRSREEHTQLQARALAREEERKRTQWLSA